MPTANAEGQIESEGSIGKLWMRYVFLATFRDVFLGTFRAVLARRCLVSAWLRDSFKAARLKQTTTSEPVAPHVVRRYLWRGGVYRRVGYLRCSIGTGTTSFV